jgi:hypothetical protein
MIFHVSVLNKFIRESFFLYIKSPKSDKSFLLTPLKHIHHGTRQRDSFKDINIIFLYYQYPNFIYYNSEYWIYIFSFIKYSDNQKLIYMSRAYATQVMHE